MKFKSLLLIMFTCFSLTASAGLLVEPYAGFGSLSTAADFVSGSNSSVSDESSTASVIGGKLGYSFILLSAGLDYQIMMGDLDGDSATISNTSLFVGVDLPILFRFWGKYIINSEFDYDVSSNLDISFKDGYALGLGFTGLPFVSLNLEYSLMNYEMEFGNNAKADYLVGATVLSVSLPLDL